MSGLSELRLLGFSALTDLGGERLTYSNGDVIVALVNRKVGTLKDNLGTRDGGRPDFSVLGMTEIEFTKTALTPDVGKHFVDLSGNIHRIRHVTQTSITWVCYCQPSVQPA